MGDVDDDDVDDDDDYDDGNNNDSGNNNDYGDDDDNNSDDYNDDYDDDDVDSNGSGVDDCDDDDDDADDDDLVLNPEILHLMLELKCLQQFAMQTVFEHRAELALEFLPRKIIKCMEIAEDKNNKKDSQRNQ